MGDWHAVGSRLGTLGDEYNTKFRNHATYFSQFLYDHCPSVKTNQNFRVPEIYAADHHFTHAFNNRRSTKFDHKNPPCLVNDMTLEIGTVPIMVIPFPSVNKHQTHTNLKNLTPTALRVPLR